jgi:2-keto-4-pentenoate hydratase/2-oxohepta-3-ene-1,7-dioic acid hydratase in catechol pathway
VYEGGVEDLSCSLENLIAEASNYYTLKIGDYLYCGNRFRYQGLKAGDRLQLLFQDKVWMDFKVK